MNIDEAINEMEQAGNRALLSTSVGAYVWNAVGILAMSWSFYWFESRAGLLRFIREVAPVYVGLSEDETARVARETRAFDTSTELREIPAAVDRLLRLIVIEWAGSFEDLCIQDEQCALSARQAFRGADDVSPIKYFERIAFSQFLQSYHHMITNQPDDTAPKIQGLTRL